MRVARLGRKFEPMEHCLRDLGKFPRQERLGIKFEHMKHDLETLKHCLRVTREA
jgi:hypothetical protein